jgi:hypothetical protein
VFAAPTAPRRERTFVGGAAGQWSDPQAWLPVGVPAANDSVVVPSGRVTLPASEVAVAVLTVRAASIVGAAGTVLRVSDSLVLNGTAFEGDGVLLMPPSVVAEPVKNASPSAPSAWQATMRGVGFLTGSLLGSSLSTVTVEGQLTVHAPAGLVFGAALIALPGSSLTLTAGSVLRVAGSGSLRGELTLGAGSTLWISSAALLAPSQLQTGSGSRLQLKGGEDEPSAAPFTVTIGLARLSLPQLILRTPATLAPTSGCVVRVTQLFLLEGLLRGAGRCEFRVADGAAEAPEWSGAADIAGPNWHLIFEGAVVRPRSHVLLTGQPGSNVSFARPIVADHVDFRGALTFLSPITASGDRFSVRECAPACRLSRVLNLFLCCCAVEPFGRRPAVWRRPARHHIPVRCARRVRLPGRCGRAPPGAHYGHDHPLPADPAAARVHQRDRDLLA